MPPAAVLQSRPVFHWDARKSVRWFPVASAHSLIWSSIASTWAGVNCDRTAFNSVWDLRGRWVTMRFLFASLSIFFTLSFKTLISPATLAHLENRVQTKVSRCEWAYHPLLPPSQWRVPMAAKATRRISERRRQTFHLSKAFVKVTSASERTLNSVLPELRTLLYQFVPRNPSALNPVFLSFLVRCPKKTEV